MLLRWDRMTVAIGPLPRRRRPLRRAGAGPVPRRRPVDRAGVPRAAGRPPLPVARARTACSSGTPASGSWPARRRPRPRSTRSASIPPTRAAASAGRCCGGLLAVADARRRRLPRGAHRQRGGARALRGGVHRGRPARRYYRPSGADAHTMRGTQALSCRAGSAGYRDVQGVETRRASASSASRARSRDGAVSGPTRWPSSPWREARALAGASCPRWRRGRTCPQAMVPAVLLARWPRPASTARDVWTRSPSTAGPGLDRCACRSGWPPGQGLRRRVGRAPLRRQT